MSLRTIIAIIPNSWNPYLLVLNFWPSREWFDYKIWHCVILNLAILSKLTFIQIKTINMLNSQTHKNFLSDTLSQLWFHLTLLFWTNFVSLLVDPHHACLILMVESTKFTFYEENIATGETSQAITPFHFFDNSNFHH